MRCRVARSRLSGDVACPASKSYTHRAIFLASLADGPSSITGALRSDDTDATIAACRGLGASILHEDGRMVVRPGRLRPANVDAANSGTTIRIASALAALADGTSTLTGDASLRRRPMQPLLDALLGMGARCESENGCPPVRVTGRISGGRVSVPGDVSSQFVSAIMMAAPLTAKGVSLDIRGDLVSKPYLEATVSSMRRFGVSVRTVMPFSRYVIAPQPYRPAEFAVPSDSSSLALLLAAAVLAGDGVRIGVTLGDLPQGDESFMDMLEVMGVRVDVGEDHVTVDPPERLPGGVFDLRNTPDLLPPLAVLAARCSGPLDLRNVGHARLKETDRIDAIATELAKVGIRADQSRSGVVLHPPDGLVGAHLEPRGDHRLFMAFCVLGMAIGDCTVGDCDSVGVSYPGFIEDMRGLGAEIETG